MLLRLKPRFLRTALNFPRDLRRFPQQRCRPRTGRLAENLWSRFEAGQGLAFNPQGTGIDRKRLPPAVEATGGSPNVLGRQGLCTAGKETRS